MHWDRSEHLIGAAQKTARASQYSIFWRVRHFLCGTAAARSWRVQTVFRSERCHEQGMVHLVFMNMPTVFTANPDARELVARIRFVLRPAMLAHLFITNLVNMWSTWRQGLFWCVRALFYSAKGRLHFSARLCWRVCWFKQTRGARLCEY